MTTLCQITTIAASIALYVCAVTIAKGDTVSIAGTRYEDLPAAVSSGRCYPGAATLYVNNEIGIATGSSNFGNFLPDMSACLHVPFPAAITNGIFAWSFDDGDTLDGTWSGLDTRVNLPGGGHLLSINETYIVTGGTGAFLDAMGQIDETGSAVSTGVSAIANYTFQGTAAAPNLVATPEPDPLILLGTCLPLLMLASSMRRRLSRNGSKRSDASTLSTCLVCVACLFMVSALCGCGANSTNAGAASGPSGSGGSSGGGSVSTGTGTTNLIAQTSIYVPSDTHNPEDTILTVPTTAKGASTPTAILSGSKVSVDDSGNIYLLDNGRAAINILAQAAPTGPPMRTLPVGTGTQIATVVDMQASPTGELFVSDGVGIAVFDSRATGSAAPARYIKGFTASSKGQPIPPGIIAVDRLGNVYVLNRIDSSVAVFGSGANGTAVPSRVVSGGLSVVPIGGVTKPLIYSMSTDVIGNLYVFCYCINPSTNQNDDVILEFGPTSAGDAAPIRWVTDPTINPNTGGDGIAVDMAGTIYLSSGTEHGIQTIFEFATSQSGNVTAASTVTIADWLDSVDSRLAVH